MKHAGIRIKGYMKSESEVAEVGFDGEGRKGNFFPTRLGSLCGIKTGAMGIFLFRIYEDSHQRKTYDACMIDMITGAYRLNLFYALQYLAPKYQDLLLDLQEK